MIEIFEMVFDVSMLAFVAGSMITLGLGLTVSQIIEKGNYNENNDHSFF